MEGLRAVVFAPDNHYWTSHMKFHNAILCVLALAPLHLHAQEEASDSRNRAIASIEAHAIFDETFTCSQHPAGELRSVGDDLGQDCVIEKMADTDGRLFPRTFQNDGYRNEDWYGWNQPVLSPCDCTVQAVRVNPVTNEPGKHGKPPASFILLMRADGTKFLLAHVNDPKVAKDQRVSAGEVIAKVGNNGYGRSPHIHIGAWKGKDALQIQWDLKTTK